jgi:hypothetical protein
VSVYETLVEDKMRRLKGECAHFSFSKCHIYTHDGASANFSTNSHETDNSVGNAALLVPAVIINLTMQETSERDWRGKDYRWRDLRGEEWRE